MPVNTYSSKRRNSVSELLKQQYQNQPLRPDTEVYALAGVDEELASQLAFNESGVSVLTLQDLVDLPVKNEPAYNFFKKKSLSIHIEVLCNNAKQVVNYFCKQSL